MFYSIRGEIRALEDSLIAVDCGGLSFACIVSGNTLSKAGPVGSEITLYTQLIFKDDSFSLYGFYDRLEAECFKNLIGVTRIGPKSALSLLSVLTPEQFLEAVASEDTALLSKGKNIGQNGAKRIVLELKDKLADRFAGLLPENSARSGELFSSSYGPDTSAGEAEAALLTLGYGRADAKRAVSAVSAENKGMKTDEIIKEALRRLL